MVSVLPPSRRLATMHLPRIEQDESTHPPDGGSMAVKVSLKVNGEPAAVEVEERTLLVTVIREHLRLTGTHVGCDAAQCGACTVSMNGKAVKSCSILAMQAEGGDITTIHCVAV